MPGFYWFTSADSEHRLRQPWLNMSWTYICSRTLTANRQKAEYRAVFSPTLQGGCVNPLHIESDGRAWMVYTPQVELRQIQNTRCGDFMTHSGRYSRNHRSWWKNRLVRLSLADSIHTADVGMAIHAGLSNLAL